MGLKGGKRDAFGEEGGLLRPCQNRVLKMGKAFGCQKKGENHRTGENAVEGGGGRGFRGKASFGGVLVKVKRDPGISRTRRGLSSERDQGGRVGDKGLWGWV